jgi:phosphatidylglycerophosphate synthase
MITASLLKDSDVVVWSVSSRERLKRQCHQIGVPLVAADALPSGGQVLLLRSDYLFDVSALSALLKRERAYLRCPVDGQLAAAIVPTEEAHQAIKHLTGPATAVPNAIGPEGLAAFDDTLRKVQPPLLEPLRADATNRLEALLYGSAYKGITDLVTKWLWPRPSKHAVRWCAATNLTPNMVTSVGFLLVVAASFAFINGYYLTGLACGWVMTFLDTVDGKLARVTAQSSRFGHYFDHVMDIVHPPFWYIWWGTALTAFEFPISTNDLNWMIIVGYIVGRLIEAVFHLLGNCGIFSWQPFDAYFRLITGRRNPCLIILTVSIFVGRPDWGFIGVALWTTITTIVMLARLLWGTFVRIISGPLESWLNDISKAQTKYPHAYNTFSNTRSAYEVS